MLVLEQLFMRRRNSHHMTVVPLGSKMQAVGAVLFSFLRPEVRLLSAEPAFYEVEHYTHGVGPGWHLRLGSVTELRQQLAEVDTIVTSIADV
jgi:hypothetical protein